MRLDVAIDGIVEDLPDAAQVRFAIRHTWNRRSRGLTSSPSLTAAALTSGRRLTDNRCQRNGENEHGSQTNQDTNSQPISHQYPPTQNEGSETVPLVFRGRAAQAQDRHSILPRDALREDVMGSILRRGTAQRDHFALFHHLLDQWLRPSIPIEYVDWRSLTFPDRLFAVGAGHFDVNPRMWIDPVELDHLALQR